MVRLDFINPFTRVLAYRCKLIRKGYKAINNWDSSVTVVIPRKQFLGREYLIQQLAAASMNAGEAAVFSDQRREVEEPHVIALVGSIEPMRPDLAPWRSS
jgi:hypothetical protein